MRKEPDEIHRRVLNNFRTHVGDTPRGALARRAGVSEDVLRMVLSGRTESITSRALQILADAAQVDVQELLHPRGDSGH